MMVPVFVAVALFLTVSGTTHRTFTGERTLSVGGVPLLVAIADSEMERARGLSGLSGLAEGEGMLFVFESAGLHAFWMKDMLFSIDILWIAADGTIVHIAPSVSPDTYPQSFIPPTPARYVLEVRAGFATEHGIEVGSKVDF
ncbi:MAG TPA: DUF192 domain-containing protein [Pyrinomonadaceae bacterium]|nr:DUF192 domain-containing protein [Pyrinomonadaceae bacterium]